MTISPSRSANLQANKNVLRPTAPEQIIADLRAEFAARFRSDPGATTAPIRMMARMVQAVEAECRRRGLPEAAIRAGVVNRSIGDVNLRLVTERDGQYDYRELADLLGVALPGEDIGGRVATGERYRRLRDRMEHHERALLARGWDVRMYDVAGVGNPLLREWLAADQQTEWGLTVAPGQVLLSTGSMDGLDKALRGLRATRWAAPDCAVVFPAPGFGVPEWQAHSIGLRVIHVHTAPEHQYKLTADQLRATLHDHPEARGVYLILSNNPTAFSYTPDELRDLLAVIAAHPCVTLLADMAYTGTGPPAEERARLAVFAEQPSLAQVIFCWSLSKVYTMTGDRFGWLCVGDPDLAAQMGMIWTNTIAALPAEWQLRFMAFYELLRDHPELRPEIAALYRLRRRALGRQLAALDADFGLFALINADDDGTVYNWSQLRPGISVYDLFTRTGIAGVPGSAFGYGDDHVRLSIGILPVPGWEALATRPRRRGKLATAL